MVGGPVGRGGGGVDLTIAQVGWPKRKQALQKLLSLYHPLKDIIYYEHDEVKNAEQDVEYMEAEIEALIAAKQLDIEHLSLIHI